MTSLPRLVIRSPHNPEPVATFQNVSEVEFATAKINGYFERGNVYVSFAGMVVERDTF